MSKKVRRKRISWFEVLVRLKNDDMKNYFNGLWTRFKDRKNGSSHLSMNRCAYYTLKHFYSTTTIDELCRELGL